MKQEAMGLAADERGFDGDVVIANSDGAVRFRVVIENPCKDPDRFIWHELHKVFEVIMLILTSSHVCVELLKNVESTDVGVAVQRFELFNLLWAELLRAHLDAVPINDDGEIVASTFHIVSRNFPHFALRIRSGNHGNSHSRCKQDHHHEKEKPQGRPLNSGSGVRLLIYLRQPCYIVKVNQPVVRAKCGKVLSRESFCCIALHQPLLVFFIFVPASRVSFFYQLLRDCLPVVEVEEC